MQAVRVIGALPPAAWPAGADWTAAGSCICVVNSHFPDLISSAACAATDMAVVRGTAGQFPPPALGNASGLPPLRHRTRNDSPSFPQTPQTQHPNAPPL